MLRLHTLTGVALALVMGIASAQAYKWTDPKTGRTIFSDRPPPAGVKAKTQGNVVPLDSSATENLPYAVRQAARDFPVTFFSAEKCQQECTQARQLLVGRGIPFSETHITTKEQLDELKRLTGQEGVPVLRVGLELSNGFNNQTWNNLLDLAGYPKSAPPGYRAPSAPAATTPTADTAPATATPQ